MKNLNWKQQIAAANNWRRAEDAGNAIQVMPVHGNQMVGSNGTSKRGFCGFPDNKQMNIRFGLLAAVICGLIASPAYGVGEHRSSESAGLPNYDVRSTVPVAADASAAQAEARLKERVPGAKIDRDKVLGSPRLVTAPRGFLSGANVKGKGASAAQLNALPAADPHRIMKDFVNEHSAVFGHDARVFDSAKVKRDGVTEHSGLRTTVWEQTVDEIPVFEGVFVENTTRNGELVNLQSRFLPDAVKAAGNGNPNWRSLAAAPPVTAVQAVAAAAANVGGRVDETSVEVEQAPQGPEKRQILKANDLTGPAWTELVWLPLNRDTMRLCWRVIFNARPQLIRYLVLVDAENGEVLLRRNLNVDLKTATYNVYPSDSPSPFSPGWDTPSTNQPPTTNRFQVVVNGAMDTNASPAGWINDSSTTNNTVGNNADAFLDRNFDQQPDVPRPSGGNTRVFNFPLNLAQAPFSYQAASTVQLFYNANYYHDRLYQLGFTEAAGNFQTTNFNRGGLENDAMICLVQAAADPPNNAVNNAFYQPAPDGIPGLIAMFVFDGPTPDRDGSLDQEVVFHELTHGTSDRLLGGGVGISELQTGGMGEGWSDFYAMALLSEPTDDVNGNYATGGYVTYDFYGLTENYYYGIRRYPYSTDMSKNPLTFKDIDPTQADPHAGIPISPLIGGGAADEVHNQGEVWCSALWEVRANLVQALGWTNGNQLAMQLVTDGLKLAPANATYLEARDAILQADAIMGGSQYEEIWLGFAKRGMGYSAECPSSDTTVGVLEFFDLPPDIVIGEPDGILEVRITPPSATVLFAGDTNNFFVRVTDSLPVTNATIVATVGGTNLVFRNDGVAPDAYADDATYSSTFNVPVGPPSITIPVLVSAPDKADSTNSVTYVIIPPPPNDYFTNATKVPAGGTNYFTSNKRATMETNEMAHAGVSSVAASLWWNYTSPVATNILVDAGGSGFQTVVAVYTNLPGSNTIATLVPVASAVGTSSRPGAFLTYNAKAGVGYRIVVAGRNKNSVGNVVLEIGPGSLADTNSPVVAVTSPQSGVLVTTNRILLTGTANDPGANASGIDRITVTLIPSPGMGEVTTTDVLPPSFARGPISTNWSKNVSLKPGRNVIIVRAYDFAGNASLPATLQVTYRELQPANDFLANAIGLTNSAGVSTVNTRQATKEVGEPNHAGNAGGKSAWWWFTAPADGVLWLSTTNSTFDTLLGLYQGNQVGNLTRIASNDDAYNDAPGGFSSINQAVRSNQTYRIALDGYDGVSGAVFLSHEFTPATVYHVTVGNTAGGSVTPSSMDVVSNSTAVITATPDEFFGFDGWTGDVPATGNPLQLVVNSNLNLMAHFKPLVYADDFETGNLQELGWVSSGNVPWQVQTNTVLAGSFSARSGIINNSQTSSLLLTTNFAGGLASFYLKVSSEPGWDFLKLFLDGNLVGQWSGEVAWFNYPFNVPGGLHTLEWRYTKDANNSAGLDAAFIDNVNLPFGLAIDPSTPAQLQIVRQPNGSLLIQVLGQTNQQYVIQGATSLAPPASWQNLSTNIATGGVILYQDPDTASNPLRFYRAVVPVP